MKRAISVSCWAVAILLVAGTAQAQTPAKIDLAEPADNATDVSVTPTLRWFTDVDAITYNLQVAEDINFGTIVLDETGIGDTLYTLGAALDDGTEYFWRVAGVGAGGTGPESNKWSFTTAIAVPGAPTLTTPADAATDVSTSPTFMWAAGSGTTDSYRIDISTSNDFSTLAVTDSGIVSTSFTPGAPLANDTEFFWRVRGKNTGGSSDWSSTFSLTTAPPAPTAPTLTAPADAAEGVSVDPTLEWDAVSGAVTYTVDVDTDPGFGSIDQTQTSGSTSYSPSTLATGTTYYWRVKATNPGGDSEYSSRSFTTIFDPPGAPALTSPADAAVDVSRTPDLTWSAGSGTSESYRLDVSTANDFSSFVITDSSIVTTSFSVVSALATETEYFWRVRAKNTGGTSAWSSTRSFTTVPAEPGVVTLTSPVDDAVEVSLTPTFDWESLPEADTYRLILSDTSDFSNLILAQDDIATSSYALGAPLELGTEYFWRVRANNAGGNGPYSAIWSFTTELSKQVILSSPANGATGVDLSPDLGWNAVAGATSYRVQVSKLANMSSPVVDQSGVSATTLAVGPLESNTIYHWRVIANNAPADLWSEIWSFATGTGAPGQVTLLTPADDATGVSLEPSFTWSAQASADEYRFDLSTSAAFSSFVVSQTGITATSFDPGITLDAETEYFWRVRGSNGEGDGPYSSVFSFTTTVAAPGAPTLTSPENGALAVSITPTFLWEAVSKGLGKTSDGSPAATSYDIQVSTGGNFNTLVVDETGLAGTSYDEATLLNGVQYFWRVRGSNESGPGPWSTTFNFITIAGGPEQVQLVSPADEAVEVALSPSLMWDAVSGAASYQLQISEVENFTTLVLNIAAVAGTSYQATGLAGSTTHYWRVRANNTGAENWSETWSFTTGSGQPDKVTLVAPVDGATNVAINLTLSWNQALKADSYDLQVATDLKFENLVVDTNTDETSQMMTTLIHGQVYYWRVRGTNADVDGEWSSIRGFITERGGDLQVKIVSPEGGATGIPLETELIWNTVPGATTYHVQVATSFSFGLSSIVIEDSQFADTLFQLVDLGPDSTYAWRVRANNAGINNWSITASFVTGSGVPGQVVLESPLDNAVDIGLEPQLIWTVPTRATSFNLQVALDETFTTLVVDEEDLTDISYTLPELDPVSVYFWRVQGENGEGVGPWSEVRSFTTIGVEPPDVAVLISPLNGAAEVSFKPLFSWNAADGATSYKLEVATNPAFTTVTLAVVVAQAFFQAPALALGQGYYWRVESRNAGGSALSEVWSFTTVVETATEDEEIPEDFALSQNYPNPFNPSTTIEFAMPTAGQASLVVYNIRGEEVVRLVDGFKSAGRHKVQWDATFLPSGVYLYRFQSGSFTNVRKLTLAK